MDTWLRPDRAIEKDDKRSKRWSWSGLKLSPRLPGHHSASGAPSPISPVPLPSSVASTSHDNSSGLMPSPTAESRKRNRTHIFSFGRHDGVASPASSPTRTATAVVATTAMTAADAADTANAVRATSSTDASRASSVATSNTIVYTTAATTTAVVFAAATAVTAETSAIVHKSTWPTPLHPRHPLRNNPLHISGFGPSEMNSSVFRRPLDRLNTSLSTSSASSFANTTHSTANSAATQVTAGSSAPSSVAPSPTSVNSALALTRRRAKTPVLSVGQLERTSVERASHERASLDGYGRPLMGEIVSSVDYLAEQYRSLLGPRDADSIYSSPPSPRPQEGTMLITQSPDSMPDYSDTKPPDVSTGLELLHRNLASALVPGAASASTALQVWVMVGVYEQLREGLRREVRSLESAAALQALDAWLRALHSVHDSLLRSERKGGTYEGEETSLYEDE